MKAFWLGLSLAAGSVLAAAGARAEPPKVVVTIKPIHSLVAQVMEGVATPELLVKGQASPHTYALRPSESRTLHTADAFYRVSDGIEPFSTKIAAALPGRVSVITLLDAPGLHKLARRTGTTFAGHAHDGHEDDHKSADGDVDGHVWLDPENARALARHIETTLGKRFPPFAQRFKHNREMLDGKLAALDAALRAELTPLKGKPFAVYHDAFQYFEHHYALRAVGAIFISQDLAPSAKRLTDLRRQIAKLNAVCVFAEPQSDPRMLQAITEGSPVRTGVLDAEGIGLEPGPDLYFQLMQDLAKGLRACLAPGA